MCVVVGAAGPAISSIILQPPTYHFSLWFKYIHICQAIDIGSPSCTCQGRVYGFSPPFVYTRGVSPVGNSFAARKHESQLKLISLFKVLHV